MKNRTAVALRRMAIIALIGGSWLAGPAPAQQPKHVQQQIDVVFAIDNSGSMRSHDPGFLTRRMVTDFGEALAGRNDVDARVGIVRFESEAKVLLPLGEISRPGDRERLAQTMQQLDFRGQRTNSPAGIERALYALDHGGRDDAHRAIIFVTDGFIDTGDAARDRDEARWLREDLAQASARAGVRIYGVAFTDAADYQLIQSLALKTDARYHRAATAEDLSRVMSAILADLADRRAAPNPAPGADPRPQTVVAGATNRPASPLPRPSKRFIEPIHLLLPIAGGLLIMAAVIAWRLREPGPLVPSATKKGTAQPTRAHRRSRIVAKLVDVARVTGNDGFNSHVTSACSRSDATITTTWSSPDAPSRVSTRPSSCATATTTSRTGGRPTAPGSTTNAYRPTRRVN